jgi:ComF family protein
MKKWHEIFERLFNYFMPFHCVLCGDKGFNGRDLCNACYVDLPQNFPLCFQCASNSISQHSNHLCSTCFENSPAFDETLAPFLHQGSIRYLILQLKFHRYFPSARLLGNLMSDYLQQTASLPDCIIPIPLHKNRYQERGFNQSIELARIIAKRLNVPLDVTSCIRYRDTAHQVGLNAQQRGENIKNAFSISKKFTAKHVALVDDVMTTGATVHELALALKMTGCERVQIWVCAKAN